MILSVLENNVAVVHGTADHYINLLNYINTHDLAMTLFHYVNSQMDVSEFLDYFIFGTFIVTRTGLRII